MTCAATRAPGSGRSAPPRVAHTSFIREVRRSAPRRELANTSVERCAATRSTTRSSTCGQIDGRRGPAAAAPDRSSGTPGLAGPAATPAVAPVRSVRSGTGTTTSTSTRLVAGGCTTCTARPASAELRAPARKVATASTGRTVADSPIRWAGPPSASSSASRRSRLRARCAPRLVPATAWISSRITVRTPASPARAAEVRTRKSDSGVVMSTSGGRVANARRSAGGVSPVRTPTLTSGSPTPAVPPTCRIPTRGPRRFRSTSAASALSGETYSTRHRRRGSSGGPSDSNRSSDHRNAARVLPDPVGATTRAWSPPPIAAHAPVCAGVGAAKAAANHSRVGAENPAGMPGPASPLALLTAASWQEPPTPAGGWAAVRRDAGLTTSASAPCRTGPTPSWRTPRRSRPPRTGG